MKRILHEYDLWEDRKAGMYEYQSLENKEALILQCVELLTNYQGFITAMRRVATEWIYSTENCLSNFNNNRRAWLGRAACCYTLGASENITQKAWLSMTKEERDKANSIANEFIKVWKDQYINI